MSSTFKNIDVEIYGESHAPEIGVIIKNLPENESVDLDELQLFLNRRKGVNKAWSTQRIEDDKIFKEFADYFKIPMAEYKSLDILNEEIYSLGVYTYNPEKLDKSKYKDLDFVLVAPLGFDVIKKGINKSSPIKDLRIMYPNAKIISFGDNYNDIEMLKASDVAIVMPTAPEKVKECATFVTKDVFEDGILYAVKEYLKYEN